MTVVDLETERERRIDAAWRSYCEARQRAEQTLDVEDGIEAGRAWRRWLDLFMTAEQRNTLDRAGEVVTPMQRRIG